MGTQLQWIQQHVAWVITILALAWAIYQYVANSLKARTEVTYRFLVDSPILGEGSLGAHKKTELRSRATIAASILPCFDLVRGAEVER